MQRQPKVQLLDWRLRRPAGRVRAGLCLRQERQGMPVMLLVVVASSKAAGIHMGGERLLLA